MLAQALGSRPRSTSRAGNRRKAARAAAVRTARHSRTLPGALLESWVSCVARHTCSKLHASRALNHLIEESSIPGWPYLDKTRMNKNSNRNGMVVVVNSTLTSNFMQGQLE